MTKVSFCTRRALGNRYGLQTRLHAGGEVLHGGRRAIEVLLAVVAHDNGDELNKLLLPLHLPLHPRHHVTFVRTSLPGKLWRKVLLWGEF